MTVYPYAVTLQVAPGKVEVISVEGFSPLDAMQMALINYTSAKNLAGETCEDVKLVRITPDYTMVRRPEADPLRNTDAMDALIGAMTARINQRSGMKNA